MASRGVLPFLRRHAGKMGKRWTTRGEGKLETVKRFDGEVSLAKELAKKARA
jgi:hypothetical protein